MLNTLSIRIKVILAFMIIGGVCILTIGLRSFYGAKKAIEEDVFEAFTAIRESKKHQIESYFQQIRNQSITFAQDLMIVNAMKEFKQAFAKIPTDFKEDAAQLSQFKEASKKYYQTNFLPRLNPNVDKKRTIEQYFEGMKDQTLILQYYYLVDNPNPNGKKDNLNKLQRDSAYSRVHAKYHPIIRDFLKKFGYYDIFLVDIESGTILYTVFKEVDFATSLLTGPFKNSSLAQDFKFVKRSLDKDFVRLVDFDFYDPSYGAPAAFIGSPIYDGDKKIGVLLFQFPVDHINQIMTNGQRWETTGLGKTGEVYLIGGDYKMRSMSRFFIEDPSHYFTLLRQLGVGVQTIDKMKLSKTTIMLQEVNTIASQEVLRGNSGTKIIDDYRRIPVISSFSPVDIKDVKWGIMAEIDSSEVFASVANLAKVIGLWGLFILIGLIIFSFFFILVITQPIKSMLTTMKRILKGNEQNLRERIAVTSNDEIGQLGISFNEFLDKTQQKMASISKIKKEFLSFVTNLKQVAHTISNLGEVSHNTVGSSIEDTKVIQGTVAQTIQIQSGLKDIVGKIDHFSNNFEQLSLSLHNSKEAMAKKLDQLQEHGQKGIALLGKKAFDLRIGLDYLDKLIIQINTMHELIKSVQLNNDAMPKLESGVEILDSMKQLMMNNNKLVNKISQGNGKQFILAKESNQMIDQTKIVLEQVNMRYNSLQENALFISKSIGAYEEKYSVLSELMNKINDHIGTLFHEIERSTVHSNKMTKVSKQLQEKISQLDKLIDDFDQVLSTIVW